MQEDLTSQLAPAFLGVNLRQERLKLADGDVAKAINADFHSQPGTIVLRLGRSRQFTTALLDTVVRSLARISSRRYQVAGRSLYRNQTRVLNGGLSANLITTLAPFRPLNDTTTWMFMADDAVMRKDDGTNVRQWGILAPAATPLLVSGGSGSLTGEYSVRYTFARVVDSTLVHESNPSPVSADLTLSSNSLAVSNLEVPSDPQVTHLRIYCTLEGGSIHIFDQQIAAGETTATITQTDTDRAAGDALEQDNDMPPEASWCFPHQEHLWLLRDADNPHYARWSKRFNPDAFPSDNFLEIGNPEDPLQCGLSIGGMAGIFSRLTKYRILGTNTSSFVPVESISRRGTLSPFAMIPTDKGALFAARDGFFSTDFTSEDKPFAEAILPLFFGETVNDMAPINWDAASRMCAAFYKNKVYFAYPSGSNLFPDTLAVYSLDTKRWYFYQYPSAVRSLLVEEEIDRLVHGSTDGFVYIMEDGFTDHHGALTPSITLDVETKDFAGETPDALKIFHYFKVDATLSGETLTAEFYVDDVLKHTASVTGDRTKLLLSLPDETMGYHWRVHLSYTGSTRIRVHGVAAYWLPLGVA